MTRIISVTIEDVDLGFRLRLSGYRCLYVPMAVAHHIGSATTGGQRSDFSVYHGHRNLVWTYVKNMPGALFWFLLPLHLLLNLITIVVFTARRQCRVILKAKWDAIKGLPQAWIKRKKIQNKRVGGIQTIWEVLKKNVVPDKKRAGMPLNTALIGFFKRVLYIAVQPRKGPTFEE